MKLLRGLAQWLLKTAGFFGGFPAENPRSQLQKTSD
jgi:hypothetical protein